ncbi:MAG: hypothetical protein MUE40_09935 [Anaerolineae bacterium]|jgi:hypothetical protein|nr:hypothetical protein [Anaerolineae bacterium]
MPVTCEKLPQQPIAIFTYAGQVTAATVAEAIQQNILFAREAGEKMYTVVDVHGIDPLNFPELLRIVGQVSRMVLKPPAEDPARLTIIVGSQQTNKLYLELLKAQGAPPIPVVPTLEDALSLIQAQRSQSDQATTAE